MVGDGIIGTRNLIPLNKRSKEEAFAIRSKGGKTVTDKQRYKTKLIAIKKRVKKGQLRTLDADWLLTRVENNKDMGLDIMDWIDQIRKETDISKQTGLLAVYNQIYKSIHGQKIELDIKVHHVIEDIDEFFDKKNGTINVTPNDEKQGSQGIEADISESTEDSDVVVQSE